MKPQQNTLANLLEALRSRLRWLYTMFCTMIYLILGLSPVCTIAQERLPCLTEYPWSGFFSGYERRGFHFGVNDEAQCEIFLIDEKRKRIGEKRKVRIYSEVIVEMPDGTRTVKRLKNDVGYHSDQEAGLDHEEIKFSAMTVGNAKVEMRVRYSGNRVTLDGQVADRGSLKKGKLYFRFRVAVPAMYGTSYRKDQEKAKIRMRRDKLRLVRVKDGKRVSLKSYETVDLMDETTARGGVSKLEVSMDGQARRTFGFTTEDGKGALRFENKEPGKAGRLWEGYQVIWERRMDDSSAAPFVIEIK